DTRIAQDSKLAFPLVAIDALRSLGVPGMRAELGDAGGQRPQDSHQVLHGERPRDRDSLGRLAVELASVLDGAGAAPHGDTEPSSRFEHRGAGRLGEMAMLVRIEMSRW